MIEYIIGGVQKAASTSLARQLSQVSGIFLPDKEYSFFELPYLGKGVKAYEEWAATVMLKNDSLGIKRPNILCDKKAVECIHEYNHDMKFIFILRDPVERLISAYSHNYFRGNITDPSLDNIVTRYLERETLTHFESDLIKNSLYGAGLSRTEGLFGADSIHLVDQSLFFKDNGLVIRGILNFLNIESELPPISKKHSQVSVYNSCRLRIGSTIGRLCFRQVNEYHRTHRLGRAGYLIWGAFRKFDKIILSKIFKAKDLHLDEELKTKMRDIFEKDFEEFSKQTKLKHCNWNKR